MARWSGSGTTSSQRRGPDYLTFFSTLTWTRCPTPSAVSLGWNVNATVRPTDRWQTRLSLNARRLTDPDNGDTEIFDVKILRGTTNFQFTERLGVRNITEFNTADETFDLNVLFNYRVNAGTVFFLGYDDHYRQEDLIFGDRDGDGESEQLFFTGNRRRTNRAIFVKMQYLLRY